MRYTEAVLVIRILADVVLTYMLLHFLSFAEVQCFHSHFSYSYGMCLQFSSSSGICCYRPLLSTSDAWMRLIWWFKRLGLSCKMLVSMFTDVISLDYFTSKTSDSNPSARWIKSQLYILIYYIYMYGKYSYLLWGLFILW